MKKYLTTLLIALTIAITTYAQSVKKDTVVLSVYNNNQRFMLYPMPFGKDKPDKDFTAEMVVALDTINVLQTATQKDSSGRYPKRWITQRKCGKLPTNVKDKVAILYLNKDCDISTQVLNAQEAGAITVILIHSTDSRDSVTLPKKSASIRYDDDIKVKIPCFTVRKGIGEKLTQMLPSLVGIQRPKTAIDSTQALQASNPLITNPLQMVNKEKANPTGMNDATTANIAAGEGSTKGYSTEKIGWDLSPNPAGQEAILHYNFSKATQISIEVFNEAGQLVTNYNLPDNPTGTLNMDVSSWVTGIYSVRLVTGDLKEVKRLVVQH